MARVKGSKHYQMVVVPHRPAYRFMIFMGFLAVVLGFGWFSFEYGKYEGNAFKGEVISEKDQIAAQLEDSQRLISEMRQELADLRIGGQIDDAANEEVLLTIERLQGQIADQNEEIRFYKGVMLPNVAHKGLRIERLDLSSVVDGRIKYSLLLTQIVDKHDFVQGDVEISIQGRQGEVEEQISLDQLKTGEQPANKFRFRYFQNLNGEIQLPEGFQPREVMVVAQSSGNRGQRLERSFDWVLNGG